MALESASISSLPRDVHRWRILPILAVLTACLAAGCGDGGSAVCDQAVELLQKNRPQEAIDVLSKETSSRACWLRAIALERQKQSADARGQIDKALAAEPKNPEYRGFALRLQLYEAKMEAADEIIRLRNDNRTSAALALFAFYAHAAKSVHHAALKKEQEGRSEGAQAMMSLNTAIALSADIPELHRELLSLALKAQLAEGVDLLSEKLARLAPDDPEILNDRIAVLIMIGRYDDAVAPAVHFYEVSRHDETSVLVLSNVLSRSNWSEEHDRLFRDLVKAHPKHAVLLTRFGVYLARTKRIQTAVDAFDAALKNEKDESTRLGLLDAMMSLVLEANAVKLAEQQLDRYRDTIRDPLMVTYFEGRIRFLRKDYQGALSKLIHVVDAQKDAVYTNRTLAADALLWTQIILADKNAAETLQKAADSLRRTTGEAAPVGDNGPAIAETPDSIQ